MPTPLDNISIDKTPSNGLSVGDQEKLQEALDKFFLSFTISFMLRQNDFSQEIIRTAIDEAE